MKDQYKQSTLYIVYYQQRVSKNQLLATFVELLVRSSLCTKKAMLKHFV